MKKDIHPSEYRLAVFKDMTTEDTFLGKTTANTKDTIVWEDGTRTLYSIHNNMILSYFNGYMATLHSFSQEIEMLPSANLLLASIAKDSFYINHVESLF